MILNSKCEISVRKNQGHSPGECKKEEEKLLQLWTKILRPRQPAEIKQSP